MNQVDNVVVAGLGEVGKPLLELISRHHRVVGVDVLPWTTRFDEVDVLHICYPFQIKGFITESIHYVELLRPKLTIINSSIPTGTTRAVACRTGAPVAHSPVRGKHTCMLNELLRYTKFVGAIDRATAKRAAQHFESIGMKTRILSSPEDTELAKLTETTYFGLLIAWAQSVERTCDKIGASYDEVVSFYDEIGFFPPVKYFPGIIGGHCVMPNIELLCRSVDLELVEAIRSSNEKKIKREAALEQQGICASDMQGPD